MTNLEKEAGGKKIIDVAAETENGMGQRRKEFLECFKKKYDGLPENSNGSEEELGDFLKVLGNNKDYPFLRDVNIATLKKLSNYNFNGGRHKRTVKHFNEIRDDIKGFNRILGLRNVITSFLNDNEEEIKEFVLPRITDDVTAADLLPNLDVMKSNLTRIVEIIRNSNFKIIRDNDYLESLKHAEAIMAANINCILQKKDKIKLAELGKEIGGTEADEIEVERLELYKRERSRIDDYKDNIPYEEKINKNISSILSDIKRFNVYLKKCIENADYLKQQLCRMEEIGGMYKPNNNKKNYK